MSSKKNIGVNQYYDKDVMYKAFLSKMEKNFTNELNINLENTIRVKCLDKKTNKYHIRIMSYRDIIYKMIHKDISLIQFIQDGEKKARSFINILRNFNTLQTEIELTNEELVEYIRYIIKGQPINDFDIEIKYEDQEVTDVITEEGIEKIEPPSIVDLVPPPEPVPPYMPEEPEDSENESTDSEQPKPNPGPEDPGDPIEPPVEPAPDPKPEPEPELEPIDFSINPSSISIEETKTANFEIIGDYDSFTVRSSDESKFTVVDKIITAKAQGNANLIITCLKAGKKETTKEFPIVITERVLLPIDFGIDPSTLSVEETKNITFDITGDFDSYETSGSNDEFFTVSDKSINGIKPGSGELIITCRKQDKKDTTKRFPVTVINKIITEKTQLSADVDNVSMYLDEDLPISINITTNAVDISYEFTGAAEILSIEKQGKTLNVKPGTIHGTGELVIKATAVDCLESEIRIPIEIKDLIDTEINVDPRVLDNVYVGQTYQLTVTTNAADFEAVSLNGKSRINKSGNNISVECNEIGEDKILITAKVEHGIENVFEYTINIQESFKLSVENVSFDDTTSIFKTETRKFKIISNTKSPITIKDTTGFVSLDTSNLTTDNTFTVNGVNEGEAPLKIKTISFVDNQEKEFILNIKIEPQVPTHIYSMAMMGAFQQLNVEKMYYILFNGIKEEVEITKGGGFEGTVRVEDVEPENLEEVFNSCIRLVASFNGADMDGPEAKEVETMMKTWRLKPFKMFVNITNGSGGAIQLSGNAKSIYALSPAQPTSFNITAIPQELATQQFMFNMMSNKAGVIPQSCKNERAMIYTAFSPDEILSMTCKEGTIEITPFDHCEFIGFPIYTLYSDTVGDFTLQATLKLANGSTTIKEIPVKVRERAILEIENNANLTGDLVLRANQPNTFNITKYTGTSIRKYSSSGSATAIDWTVEVSPDKTQLIVTPNKTTNESGYIGSMVTNREAEMLEFEFVFRYSRIE